MNDTSTPQPNLFVVGAPKCGTTAWVSYLARHRDIFFCEPKEPHYFNSDIPEFRWYCTRESYLKLFAEANNSKIVGEASVLYLFSTEAAAHLHAFAPSARIVAFVRSPEDFVPSYHQQQLYNLDENEPDLSRAWHLSGQRYGRSLPESCRNARLLDYKSVGMFAEQIERFLVRFGEEQVRIIRFEDWIADPRGTYLLLLSFLGVVDDGQNRFERINAAHDHRSQLVARLTQRPPEAARSISRRIRKIPGLSAVQPARLLRSLNRREGYRQSNQNADLLAQIREHYAEDQAKLDRLIEKVGLHARNF